MKETMSKIADVASTVLAFIAAVFVVLNPFWALTATNSWDSRK